MRHSPKAMSCALTMATMVLTITVGAGSASAEMVAFWNFNGFDPDNGPIVAASSGSGTVNCTSFGTGLTSFAGTDVNAPTGVLAGDSVGLTGSSNNGAFALIEFSSVGYNDLSLSFAARRSSTGFGNDRVEALVGGVWTLVSTFNPSTTAWTTVTVDLSSFSSLNNSAAALRLVFDGATSGSGTVRFDNLLLSGSAVPGPGALALLGCAGIVARRRRR